jgi:hypothetical protein
MTTTALALANVAPATVNVTAEPDIYKVVLAMKTPELKQYVRDKFDEGQRICDELKAALQELKDRAKSEGVWQQTLLDCGINPATWRSWNFRELNKLTTGTRTGSRNPKPTPKIVHVPVTAAQIAALARLDDAHAQLDTVAAGDGGMKDQAAAIIKKCEIDAGVSTEEVVVVDTPTVDWKSVVIKLVTAIKRDSHFDSLDGQTRAAITAAEDLYSSAPTDPQPTKLTTPPKPRKEKNVKPCVEHNLLDCTRCAKQDAKRKQPKTKKKSKTDASYTPEEIAALPPLWDDEAEVCAAADMEDFAEEEEEGDEE